MSLVTVSFVALSADTQTPKTHPQTDRTDYSTLCRSLAHSVKILITVMKWQWQHTISFAISSLIVLCCPAKTSVQ